MEPDRGYSSAHRSVSIAWTGVPSQVVTNVVLALLRHRPSVNGVGSRDPSMARSASSSVDPS
jgi:hypothetical protein